jgi:hypothetical protein
MTIEILGTDPEPSPRRPRSRVSGWEVALWVIGILLIGSGIAIVLGLAQTIDEESTSTFTNTNATPLQVFLQTASVVTPGLLTGGVICVALAIFARVLDAHARNREPPITLGTLGALAPSEELARAAEAAEQPTTSAPTAGAPTPTTDYSPFMRPSGDPTDPEP